MYLNDVENHIYLYIYIYIYIYIFTCINAFTIFICGVYLCSNNVELHGAEARRFLYII